MIGMSLTFSARVLLYRDNRLAFFYVRGLTKNEMRLKGKDSEKRIDLRCIRLIRMTNLNGNGHNEFMVIFDIMVEKTIKFLMRT